MTKRKDWVDIIRGLAVILVVIGHANPSAYYFFLFTSPIKMPLFFVISGYLFNNRNGSYRVFFKNLFVRIIIPWMFLGLFPILLMVPFKGVAVFPEHFLKMISGESIWFMPCFIIGEILFFSILKFFGKGELGVIIVCLTISIIGYYCTKFNILDYSMTNRAMAVQAFFLLGWLFKNHEEKVFVKDWKFVLGGLLLYGSLCFTIYSLYPGQTIDVHLGEYVNPCLSIVLIVIGCWLSFSIARAVNEYPKVFTQFGKDSLLIYIWSPFILIALNHLSLIIGVGSNDFLWHTVLALFTCVICCVIAMPINKYIPVLVGKRIGNGKR